MSNGDNHDSIEIEHQPPLDVNAETNGSVVSDGQCPTTELSPPQWDASSLLKLGNSSVHKRELHDASVAAVLVEWCQHTSMHGVSYASDVEHFRHWKSIIWLLLVLVCVCVLFVTGYELISEYLQYDVTSQTQTISPPSLYFPEVTVCNMGSKQKSRYEAARNNSWAPGQVRPKNESQLFEISQPLTEFIRKSWFNLKPLNVSEFWEPVLTLHGLCYKFALNNTGSLKNESVTRPGLEAGLGFLAFLNLTEYDSSVTFAGVRIFVTQPGIKFVNLAPFALAAPGAFQYVALQRQDFRREITKPWSKCNGHAPEYTQSTCRFLCIAHEIRATCNCRSWSDYSNSDLDFCQDFDGCYESIVSGEDESEDLTTCNSKCLLPPCTEDQFTTSSTTLPVFANRAISSADDFVEVQINYEAIRYDLITESKAQSLTQLLGSIGGQMGLFVGISLISITELVVELTMLRLIPRLWGDRRLFGIGSNADRKSR